MSFFKQPRWENKDYTDWVKSLPSVVSQFPADDPHHVKGHGLGGTTRPSDIYTFPLTREEHTHLHNIGWQSWEEVHGSQLLYALRTVEKALVEGVLKIG